MQKELEKKTKISFGINILYLITITILVSGAFYTLKYYNQNNSILNLIFVLSTIISIQFSICYLFLVTMKIKQHEIEMLKNRNEET